MPPLLIIFSANQLLIRRQVYWMSQYVQITAHRPYERLAVYRTTPPDHVLLIAISSGSFVRHSPIHPFLSHQR
jgi:hypothetical protein